MKRNIIITLATVLFGVFALATNAYALPPKPNMPGGPEVPSQPELPPCVECEEVFGTPSPSPSVEPTATPTPGQGENPIPTLSPANSPSPAGGNGPEPQVLGLADTSSGADLYSILTVLGLSVSGLGIRLRGKQ